MDEEITIKRQKAYAKRKEDEINYRKEMTERARILSLQQKVDADLDRAIAERDRIKTERERIESEYKKAEVECKRAFSEWQKVYPDEESN